MVPSSYYRETLIYSGLEAAKQTARVVVNHQSWTGGASAKTASIIVNYDASVIAQVEFLNEGGFKRYFDTFENLEA